jgi:hypothetical protein
MRVIWSVLLLAALTPLGVAQEGGGEPDKEKGGDKPAAKPEEPKEAPAWKLSERDAKRVEKFIDEYLHPKRKNRKEILFDFQKFLDKPIDGHSALEDVAALESIAARHRELNKKCGKKGKIESYEVRPDVHGFPMGIGTVKYHLYLPSGYDLRKSTYPLIFCLPDNRRWPDGAAYIDKVWVKRSKVIADNYIIVVPRPQSKGRRWTEARSLARAMIALRHACGTFDVTEKTGGPATAIRRVFIDGEEAAAQIAARFAELFVGAILRKCDGKSGSGPDLRKAGGLNGLPAYFLFEESKRNQKQFGEKVKAANAATKLVAADKGDTNLLGNINAIVSWMDKLVRVTQPRQIEYTVHEASFQRHYWINVRAYDASVKPAAWFAATADRAKNEVVVDVNGVTRFELFLNDAVVDLNKELRIVVTDGEEQHEFYKDTASRDLGVMLNELVASNHPWRIYPVRFLVDLKVLKERAAKRKAAEEAEKKAGEKKEAAPAGSSMKEQGK